jgi:hypothetical protein
MSAVNRHQQNRTMIRQLPVSHAVAVLRESSWAKK